MTEKKGKQLMKNKNQNELKVTLSKLHRQLTYLDNLSRSLQGFRGGRTR